MSEAAPDPKDRERSLEDELRSVPRQAVTQRMARPMLVEAGTVAVATVANVILLLLAWAAPEVMVREDPGNGWLLPFQIYAFITQVASLTYSIWTIYQMVKGVRAALRVRKARKNGTYDGPTCAHCGGAHETSNLDAPLRPLRNTMVAPSRLALRAAMLPLVPMASYTLVVDFGWAASVALAVTTLLFLTIEAAEAVVHWAMVRTLEMVRFLRPAPKDTPEV